MTITDYTPYVQQGDGVTTVRTINWKPISLSFIKVEKEEIATGTRTELTSPADYTAALLVNGTFTVTISPALTSDFNLLVYLDAPFTQEQPYRTSFGWDGKVVEDSFDKLTVLTQQVNDASNRSLRLAIGSSASAQLPSPVPGNVLSWNAAGNAIINYTPNTGAYLAADVDYISYSADRAKWFASWVDVTGGTTTNLGAANSLRINILGSNVISSFGSIGVNGYLYIVRHNGVNTVTNNANIILKNGGSNRITAAGDVQILTYKGSGVWEELSWQPATPITEGTFTPVIAGASSAGVGTYSQQRGTYKRFGNLVWYQIYLVWSAHTGTGNFTLTGFPITSANLAGGHAAGQLWYNNLTIGSGKEAALIIDPNSTTAQLYACDAAGGANANVAIDGSGQIIVSGTYFV